MSRKYKNYITIILSLMTGCGHMVTVQLSTRPTLSTCLRWIPMSEFQWRIFHSTQWHCHSIFSSSVCLWFVYLVGWQWKDCRLLWHVSTISTLLRNLKYFCSSYLRILVKKFKMWGLSSFYFYFNIQEVFNF